MTMIKLMQVNKLCSKLFSIFFLFLLLQLLSPGYDLAQDKMELYGGCSACGGGVLFVDSKAFIALCRPVMSILC